MAVDTRDPLSWLKAALETALAAENATVETVYTGPDRGSLTIYRQGTLLQTSYFSSFEIQGLRDGGTNALEKQKAAILEQVHRLLNPPKPQNIDLTSLGPLRKPRPKKAAAAAPSAAPAAEEAEGDAEAPEAEAPEAEAEAEA